MLRAALRLLAGSARSLPVDPDTDARVTLGAESTTGVFLDTLALREAILADDVVLQESPDEHVFVLHRVAGCRARPLGTFRDAATAWRALDEVDDALAGRRSAPPAFAV